MQLGYDKKRGLISVLVLVFSLSSFARSSDEKVMQFYLSKPAFSNIVGVIGNLNNKMRQAAQNPMDDWRRDEVRNAFAQLPPAIVGLAQTFKKGELHDGDYPFIRDALGGFIDVAFLGKAKEFMSNPSADLIPSTGGNFPSGSVVMQDSDRDSASPGVKFSDSSKGSRASNISDGVTNPTGGLVELSGLTAGVLRIRLALKRLTAQIYPVRERSQIPRLILYGRKQRSFLQPSIISLSLEINSIVNFFSSRDK
jgi:hypothetical protein